MTQTKERVQIRTLTEAGQRTLEAELAIDAPVEAVWKALTDADELMSWFPWQAKVTPDVGGSITLAWGDAMSGDCKIEAWEPNRYLRTTWQAPTEGLSDPGVPLAVDYYLEGRGGGTTLRLVHSGFSAQEDWDEIFDAHRRGWSYELRSLQHYLEHHQGRRRGIAKARRELDIPLEEAWDRLMSPQGFLKEGNFEGLHEGDRYAVTTATGDRLEGELRLSIRPTDLAATVDNMNHALLRILVERFGGPESPFELQLWLSSWATPDEELRALESRWQGMLDELYAA